MDTESLINIGNLCKTDQKHEAEQKKLDELCQKFAQVEVESCMFLLLPTDITLDIFSRLPAERILQCRQVCKTWRTLLHLPYFADMHLRRHQIVQLDDDHNKHSNNGIAAKVGSGFVLSILLSSKDIHNFELYYGEYDDENNNEHEQFSYINTLRKFNVNPPINERRIVGSCNGLICFTGYGKNYVYDHIICNPITGEHKKLYDESFHDWPMVSGFGYIPSSKEYKIVKIYRDGRVQVYTLGDGRWRHKRKISGELSLQSYSLYGPGIFTNGALHWLDYSGMKILAFNLADEEFNVILSPPCFLPVGYDSVKHYFSLQELGGCLCVVYQVRYERLDIWSLKKTKSTTTTTTHKLNEQECQSWTWNREFSMKWEGSEWNNFEPFAVTKSGKILLWQNWKILFCYDPSTATLKKLVDGDRRGLSFSQAIPHMNSIVSLKDLGERCEKWKIHMH